MIKDYIIEENQGVLRFTINRPERRNAINFGVMVGLEEVLELSEKHDYKALIITGCGETAFCSGGDLSVFRDLKTEKEAYQMLSKMSDILYRILTLRIPTIALLNGIAVGGGCELATACDMRFAREGVKAGFIQGKLAITTGWGGGSMLLEKIQTSNALKLMMTASLFNVEELTAMGFVDGLYSDAEQFREKVLKLESGVLVAYKKLLVEKWVATNLKNRIQAEVAECAKLWEKEEHHLMVDRFLAKDKK